MKKVKRKITYNDTISLENLLEAWQEFLKGKRGRKDVQIFGKKFKRKSSLFVMI